MNRTNDLEVGSLQKLAAIANEKEQETLSRQEAEFLQLDTWDTEQILEEGGTHG